MPQVKVITNPAASGDKSKATLGISCTGTGRDCIRSLNIPDDFSKACKLLAKRNCVDIDLGHVKYISDGRKNQRYYIIRQDSDSLPL